MKKKVVIWGAGGTGKRVFNSLSDSCDVIGFVDCDIAKQHKYIFGVKVFSPEELKNLEFDILYYGTLMGKDEIEKQLCELGIAGVEINRSYVDISVESRVFFLKNFAREIYHYGKEGAVAEAGVYRGAYARYINSSFPDRKCYLFDTFEGFSEKDYEFEKELSLTEAEHLRNTTIEQVLDVMPHKEMVCVKKGYFPSTTIGIEDHFCFVSLDMDLYKPTVEGLKFFYPRMVSGGVILIHDYFSEAYPNVRQAVDDFEQEFEALIRMPIGDDISLAIIKR